MKFQAEGNSRNRKASTAKRPERERERRTKWRGEIQNEGGTRKKEEREDEKGGIEIFGSDIRL